MADKDKDLPIIVIEAGKRKTLFFRLKELYKRCDILWVLAYRDLRSRYAQTTLGLLWVVLQPMVSLVIFTLVFGLAIKVDTGEVPYPLFAFSGLFAWQYFSYAVGNAGTSLVHAQNLITKIYFPRLIIPLSKAVVGLSDFLVQCILLLLLLIIYGYWQGNFWALPLLILWLLIASLGIGIWASALIIRFRDFQPILAFSLQIGTYLSPIAYPTKIIPNAYQVFYFLNPMAGVIEGFRFTLLGEPFSKFAFISLGLSILLLFSGLWFFRRTERVVADIV